MAFQPPVSIPSLSDRNYARDLYGMMSGVGDAFRQNRRDKIGDEQWAAEQQRLATNSDRDYALQLRRLEADQAGGNENWFGNLYDVELPGGGYGKAMVSNRGNVKLIDAPGGGGMPAASPDAGASAAYGGGGQSQGGRWLPTASTTDLGNQVIVRDKFGRPIGTFPKGGTPPPGYIPTMGPDGNVSFSPGAGTPQERERTREETQARARLNAFEMDAEGVIGMIGEARELIKGGWATGTMGALMSVPGLIMPTERGELENIRQSIMANVGFDKLQQMREMSPTGGALGQVSDFENRLLQAIRGPMDPMNPEQMQQTLDAIEARYEEAAIAYRIAYMTDFEGLPRDVANGAIDAIRQGKDPQAVMQRVQQYAGGQ